MQFLLSCSCLVLFLLLLCMKQGNLITFSKTFSAYIHFLPIYKTLSHFLATSFALFVDTRTHTKVILAQIFSWDSILVRYFGKPRVQGCNRNDVLWCQTYKCTNTNTQIQCIPKHKECWNASASKAYHVLYFWKEEEKI